MTDKAEITNIVDLYAMVSRMRVLSNPAVVQATEVVIRLVIDTYFQPSKTLRELHGILTSQHLDPLGGVEAAVGTTNFHERVTDGVHAWLQLESRDGG